MEVHVGEEGVGGRLSRRLDAALDAAQLIGAHVVGSGAVPVAVGGAGGAALVGTHGIAVHVRAAAGVDGRAAHVQGVGLGGSAIVPQRAHQHARCANEKGQGNQLKRPVWGLFVHTIAYPYHDKQHHNHRYGAYQANIQHKPNQLVMRPVTP